VQTRFHAQARNVGGWLLLGVLVLTAAAAAVALAVSLVWVRYHDLGAHEAEKQALSDIAAGLRGYAMDTGLIPAPATVLPVVAARSGVALSQMQANRRGNPRVIIADPDIGLGPSGTGSLPYTQGQTGSRFPRNPRLVMLSSLGRALPSTFIEGATLTTAQFSNIWSAAQGQKPAGWEWTGSPNDLCIGRVHFGDLFVSLVLKYYTTNTTDRGRYAVASDRFVTNTPATLAATSVTNSYLRGSYLFLYSPGSTVTPQFADILQEDNLTYTCQNGVWRRGEGVGANRVGAVIRHPTPEEFADAVLMFMDPETTLWPNNTESTKDQLLYAVLNFLGKGATNNLGEAMSDAQELMIDRWVQFTGAGPNSP
jgi:hypothetical protein